MSGTLYVVATPIGNLEDITLRALRILRQVALIAAEDTRRTARLLAHHGIATRTTSLHEHNTRARVPQLMSKLRAGDDIALVSDAGTPILSDPGVELVRACIDEGIAVDPIPGPSAALAALVASGFSAERVVFLGFPPAKGNARKRWLDDVAGRPETLILFESPHRMASLLQAIASLCGERPMFLARELTKVHQEFLRGNGQVLLDKLGSPRGEYTLVLSSWSIPQTVGPSAVQAELVLADFGRLISAGGLTRREAVRKLASKYGERPRIIYSMLEAGRVLG